jgi:hypothetical protein
MISNQSELGYWNLKNKHNIYDVFCVTHIFTGKRSNEKKPNNFVLIIFFFDCRQRYLRSSSIDENDLLFEKI